MRVPRAVWVAIATVPVLAIIALMAWGVASKPGGNPGGLVTFSKTGEARLVKTQPSDFTLNLLDGGTFTLSSVLGRPVMIDFWASWCVPCRLEADDLEVAWRKYKDKGVVFVGINIWDSEKDARDFVRRFNTSYPVGTDPKGEAAVEYGVTGIPEKFFLDRQGRIVKKYVGPFNEERLSQVLDELLSR